MLNAYKSFVEKLDRYSSRATLSVAAAFISISLLTGCLTRAEQEVVVYCALDREFSEPILADFESSTGVRILPKYDVESTKTVGLATAIIEEQNRPRCDLFWNNEILHTLRLEQMGLLEVYRSPSADSFPDEYVSSDGLWHGFASRARILLVNKERLPDESNWPRSILELADEQWQGDCAIAKPLFGTTATHAAVLYEHWGAERALAFFQQVDANAAVLSGNKQVAVGVARGDYAFGLTDTDDAWVEIQRGAPVEIVFPDQRPASPDREALGTLFIPNTLAIVRGSSNQPATQQLVDWLLSPEVEARLALGASAQIPVNPKVQIRSPVQPSEKLSWMKVDFRAAAERWDLASKQLRELFQTVD